MTLIGIEGDRMGLSAACGHVLGRLPRLIASTKGFPEPPVLGHDSPEVASQTRTHCVRSVP